MDDSVDEGPGPSTSSMAMAKAKTPQKDKRKSKAKPRKMKVKVKVKRQRRLSEEPDLSDIDDDDDDEPAETGPVGNNGNRHSVPMKLQLRLIETNVARLMKERDQITNIHNTVVESEALMRKELEKINELMNYVKNTALNKMTPDEWKIFYEKVFMDKLFGSGLGFESDPTWEELRASFAHANETSHLDEDGELELD